MSSPPLTETDVFFIVFALIFGIFMVFKLAKERAIKVSSRDCVEFDDNEELYYMHYLETG